MTRIITVTSGKGGVGKTNISTNLSICLANQGHRTCLFDADLGLANIDILLGLHPELDLSHVVLDDRPISDVLIKDYMGIDIIPGSSGVSGIADLKPNQLDRLIKSFSDLDAYDFFFFDTSAGISKNVVSFCMSSPEVILVLTPEPTSMTDGYALLKTLTVNGFEGSVRVAINQAKDIENARTVYARFKNTVNKYLSVHLSPIGAIFQDPNVVMAVKEQKPFFSLYPDTIASRSIRAIAKSLVAKGSDDIERQGLNDFWSRYLEMFQSPLKLAAMSSIGDSKISENAEKERPELIPKISRAAETSSEEEASLPKNENHKFESTEISLLLNRILECVSSLSEDVSVIRDAVTTEKKIQSDIPEPSKETISRKATIIPLNFDRFADNRSQMESEV